MSYLKSSLLQKFSVFPVHCGSKISLSTLPFTIPEPIERSPTDLLQALADRIGTDPTAPHYGNHDDPVLISEILARNKNYFMCKEYGRRAARKLVEEWPTLFMFDRDQPRLSAFRPRKPLDASIVRADQKNLVKLISEKHVEEAAKLYERICEVNRPVSKEVQLNLFHLVAYYNAQSVPLHEQEWPGARAYYRKKTQLRLEGGIVDILFEELEKTEEVYSTMICHLLKFPRGTAGSRSCAQAFSLLREMLRKKLVPHEEVFNWFIIHRLYIRSEDYHRRSETYNPGKVLRVMKELKVRPSRKTFDAMRSWEPRRYDNR